MSDFIMAAGHLTTAETDHRGPILEQLTVSTIWDKIVKLRNDPTLSLEEVCKGEEEGWSVRCSIKDYYLMVKVMWELLGYHRFQVRNLMKPTILLKDIAGGIKVTEDETLDEKDYFWLYDLYARVINYHP